MPSLSELLRNFLTFRWSPRLAVALCAVLGMLLPAAYGYVVGIPIPKIHDEYSYLLAADTFASGRLTNPTPDCPEFFEAQHILVAPTYMSKYPPGQGLVLAAGQAFCGHPVWGVWLSCGLFAGSLCWMLQAWTSPKWANVATMFAVVGFGISSYWAQSYWGGMLPACGGALLYGGLRRTLRRPRVSSSVLMALGVVVLADTRPFEGLLACIPAGVLLCRWLIADTATSLSQRLVRWLFPFATILLAGFWANAIYNQAITGDPWCLPYSVHHRQYFHQGPFVCSGLYSPEREPHPWLARFYSDLRFDPVRGVGLLAFKLIQNGTERFQGTLASTLAEMTFNGEHGRGSLIWIGILLVVGLRSRWGFFCVASVLFVVFGQSFVEYWFAHYAAPIVPLILTVLAEAVRRVSLSRPKICQTALATPGALAILTFCFAMANFGGVAVVGLFRLGQNKNSTTVSAKAETKRIASRQDLVTRLSERGGGHLVFVRYDKTYTLHGNWVYNSADLNTARVIFAHDFDDAKNRELIARHSSRSIWLCTLYRGRCEVRPYQGQDQTTGQTTPGDTDRPREAEGQQ